ncbi:hypothetical protein GIB67_021208 [Kingdonia uniflora]|uniref:Uncharacterized protein n=1 Tax=Kingdonia uniflora TaxID=39325 RepID=A0A7J7LFN7_9MAGN|nr:hypothetical protein GIB67_021208 [Kingdonia uniflora]
MNLLRDDVAAKSAQGNNGTEQTKVHLMRVNVEKQDPSRKINTTMLDGGLTILVNLLISCITSLMVYSLDKICARFLLGFVFPVMWYYATVLYFGNYYNEDPREMAGLTASAIAVSAHLFVFLLSVVLWQ